jgi:hypothetical protein
MDDIGSHQHPVDLERVAAAQAARLSDADAAGLAGRVGVSASRSGRGGCVPRHAMRMQSPGRAGALKRPVKPPCPFEPDGFPRQAC